MSQAQLEVLVVDGDESVRRAVRRGLHLMGLSVRLTATGQEAVELYRQHRDSIAVVLLEVRMPGLDGPQTLAALRQIDPHVRAVFMSGETNAGTVADLLALGAEDFVHKPFDFSDVARSLRSLAV